MTRHDTAVARGAGWAIGDPAEPGSGPGEALSDCVFLVLLVALSCLPYVGGLGFYSDDWAFMAELGRAGDSLREMWDALMPLGFETRPVQAVLVAGLYSLFELDPSGYHVANTGVLAGAAVLFYLSLRRLGVPRVLTLAIPLVFALLPHYSTDRFWIAAFQANASVFLYFLSLYADLRFVHGGGMGRWLWKMLGAAGVVGSVLAYEVTGALFLVNVPVLLYAAHARAHSRKGRSWRPRITPTTLAIAANVLALALAVAYKMTTTVRADLSGGYRIRLLRIVREAVPVHFGEYGLALPVQVVRVLRDYPSGAGIVVSLLVGVAAAGYLYRLAPPAHTELDRTVSWPAVILLGGALFAAGYAVTLTTWEIGFHPTGSNNRTAVAAAIGVAWVFVGAVGWIASLLPHGRPRRLAFAGLVGLLLASNTLIIDAIAGFWVEADRQQRQVMASIQQEFPDLPPETTLLLDGICPYVGPAMVFVTSWDMTGMLRLQYGDRSLQGDVIKLNTDVTPDGIRTLYFDDVINVYPYGDRLVVHHVGIGGAFTLRDMEGALRYFHEVGAAARRPCPPHTDGDGAPIFSGSSAHAGVATGRTGGT